MRQLASFLLLGFAVAAGAADTWRWKDANGVVHYSDRPAPGAERIQVGSSSGPGNAEPAAAPPAAAGASQVQEASGVMPYTACVVVAPASDEVFNAVNSVSASLQLTPELQEGHRIQVLLDGKDYPAWPESVLSYTIVDIYRGSHSLSVRVVDADGQNLCSGPAVTFHVRQPSVLAPARQPVRR